MKKVLISAALVATQLAAPVMADPGQMRRDVRVSTLDLDLGTREGIDALDRRLARAVIKACGTAHHLDPEALNDMDRCRADARHRAMIARKAILDREAVAAAPPVGTFK